MGDNPLHVLFGSGQVGLHLAARLAAQTLDVRTLSRHRPPALDSRVDWRAVDATDPEASIDAAKAVSLRPPSGVQNIVLPPLWALAKLVGIRPHTTAGIAERNRNLRGTHDLGHLVRAVHQGYVPDPV